MGKIMQVRVKRRCYMFFLCCSCARLQQVDEEDQYRMTQNTNLDMNDGSKEKVLEDDENLVEEYKDADASSDDKNASNSSESYGIFSGSITSDLVSPNDVTANKKPKRPDSIRYYITPQSPHLERDIRADTGKILRCLCEHSGKLDRILENLEKSNETELFLRKVQEFQARVEYISGSMSDQDTDTATITSESDESQLLTQQATSDSRIASEHDEKLESLEGYYSGCNVSAAGYAGQENSDTTNSYGSARQRKFQFSEQRVPKEHVDNSSGEFMSNSSTHAQIILDQFEELKSCAQKHSSNCGSSAANEVSKVISHMEAQIITIPRNSPQMLTTNSSVLRTRIPATFPRNSPRGLSAMELRTRSFMRASYPSPIHNELIEMEVFLPK